MAASSGTSGGHSTKHRALSLTSAKYVTASLRFPLVPKVARERPGVYLADIMEPAIEMIAPLADEFLRHAAKIEILFEDETAPTFLAREPMATVKVPMPEPIRTAS